jgi:hypothetical protein
LTYAPHSLTEVFNGCILDTVSLKETAILAKIVAQRETENKSFEVVANGSRTELLDSGVGASLPVFLLTREERGIAHAEPYAAQH